MLDLPNTPSPLPSLHCGLYLYDLEMNFADSFNVQQTHEATAPRAVAIDSPHTIRERHCVWHDMKTS